MSKDKREERREEIQYVESIANLIKGKNKKKFS
jgi:hypothetical protein